MITKKLIEEFDENIIKAFVQKNSDYYLNKWKLMATTGSKISWNWPAFLFGVFWLVYRKMYLQSFILIIASIITSFIPFINMIFALAIWIGLGLFGNYIYSYFTYNKLLEIKNLAKNEEEIRFLAIQKGGTSVVGVLVLIGIFILLEILFMVIIASVSSNSYY